MKPRTASIVLIAIFLSGMIVTSQPNADAAKSPVPTPTVGPSPTPGPDLSAFDPHWRANPKKIKPKNVPYIEWSGGTISNLSCSAWGCEVCPDPGSDPYGFFVCNERNEERYLIWWMQNIPGLGNSSYGRTGAIRPNWWTFKFQ
jgi:hypothetical protein